MCLYSSLSLDEYLSNQVAFPISFSGATASTTLPPCVIATHFPMALCLYLGIFNLAGIFAARICDLVTSKNNVKRIKYRVWFVWLQLYIVKFGDQNETKWEYPMTVPVVPLENTFSYLPLTTGRLSSKWQFSNHAV